VDGFVGAYTDLVYNRNGKPEGELQTDKHNYSVAQKYDLANRNLTWKKLKYITDEIFIDLRWRQRKTIHFQTSIMLIGFLFFFRMFVHYFGQWIMC
jgi:hypothetical protein